MKNKSALYVLISAFLFGGYGVWARFLSEDFTAFTSTWTRSIIIIALLIPIVLKTHSFTVPKKKDLPWLAASLIPGSLVLPLNFIGYRDLGVGAATLIFFVCYVLFQYLIGWIVFKEDFGISKFLSFVLGVSGLYLVSSAQIDQSSFFPVIALFFAGLFAASEVAFTKKYSHSYNAFYITLILYILTLVVSLFGDIILQDPIHIPTTITPWLYQIGFAISAIFAFAAVMIGYKKIDASAGAIIGLSEIVFGVIFGAVFFKEIVTMNIIFGVILISTASLLPMLKLKRS